MSTSSPVQTVIDGKYEILLDQEIGRGGIAVVRKGLQIATGRTVAIKQLQSGFRSRPEVVRRFRNEARMTSFASHPNIVGYLDYDPGGPWLVLEYIEGRDLKTILASGALPLAAAVGHLSHIANALEYLHDRSVVHLDIKPQNALVDVRGNVTLIDLGLAQKFANQQDTIESHIFGTAAYMAPEQVSSQPVGVATDIYSLGCVFHEMVTGAPPFSAPGLSGDTEQQALVDQHLYAKPVSPSACRPDLQIPTWVDELVVTALQKRPEDRFDSARAFARAAKRGLGADPAPVRVLTRQPTGLIGTASLVAAESFAGVASPNHEGAEHAPNRAGVVRRAWISGGRRLRQSSHVTRALWRLALLAAIVTLVSGANVASDGSVSQLMSIAMRAAPDLTTSVSTDVLNVRSEPRIDALVVATIVTDDEVVVTGLPADGSDLEWWPVEIASGDRTIEGWVWAEGIESGVWMNLLAAPDAVGDGVDTVSSWWPW